MRIPNLDTGNPVTFSNANGVSFGTAGDVVTASVNAGGGGVAMAVPGTSITSGTAVFSNLNGVSFGINGQTVTASVGAAVAPTLQFWQNQNAPMMNATTADGSLWFVPLALDIFPGNMVPDNFCLKVGMVSSQTTSSGSINLYLGLYRMTTAGGGLSASINIHLINSVSTQLTWNATSNNSSAFGGSRWVNFSNSQWSVPLTLSNTNGYILGYIWQSSNATQNFVMLGQEMFGVSMMSNSWGNPLGAVVSQHYPWVGAYSTTTYGFPGDVAFNEFNQVVVLTQLPALVAYNSGFFFR